MRLIFCSLLLCLLLLNSNSIAEYSYGTSTLKVIIRCPNCGAENPSEAKFCKECGKPLQKIIICNKCGERNFENDKFCRKCGFSLHSKETSIDTTQLKGLLVNDTTLAKLDELVKIRVREEVKRELNRQVAIEVRKEVEKIKTETVIQSKKDDKATDSFLKAVGSITLVCGGIVFLVILLSGLGD